MNGFGIYVHWPYCTRICPYCDFNVYRARDVDAEPLLLAIEADIQAHAERFGRREVTSVFLGGGTPSLLSGRRLARVLESADRAFGLGRACEISLEANPEDAARFAEQAAAGVNRFSVGAQAFDDAALKALGRWHDAAQALGAVEAAAATGRRVSLDLIYAREGQGLDAWRSELRAALALPVEHVSLYQLTIEPETAFARRVARGDLKPPGADLAADLYDATQEVCAAAGFAAYEISNHARDAAARSQHNLLYWRSEDWIGVGPGAHGRISNAGKRIATEAHRRPGDYVDAMRESGVGWIEESELSGEQWADEVALMGLRIDEGVDLERISGLRGRSVDAAAVSWLSGQGLVEQAGSMLRLTAAGRKLANKIAADLLA